MNDRQVFSSITTAGPTSPIRPNLPVRSPRGVTMDVGDFLRELGLLQYEAAFRDNRIDIRVLPKLTAGDLKDLGVTLVGDRRMLLDARACST